MLEKKQNKAINFFFNRGDDRTMFTPILNKLRITFPLAIAIIFCDTP